MMEVAEEEVGWDLEEVMGVVDEGRQRAAVGEGLEWRDSGTLES